MSETKFADETKFAGQVRLSECVPKILKTRNASVNYIKSVLNTISRNLFNWHPYVFKAEKKLMRNEVIEASLQHLPKELSNIIQQYDE